MYSFLSKHGQMAAIILGVLGVLIFFVSAYTSLSSSGYDFGTDLVEVGKKNQYADISAFDAGIYFTTFLIIVAIGLLVFFGVINLIKFPKSASKTLIAIVALVVIYFVFRAVSSNETAGRLGALLQREDITESLSKSISGGLWVTLLLAAIAGLSMLFFEVRNMFK